MTTAIVVSVGVLTIIAAHDYLRHRTQLRHPYHWSCGRCDYRLESSDAAAVARGANQHEQTHQEVSP